MGNSYGRSNYATAGMIVILCATTLTVRADPIYRSTGPDGEVTYSSEPVPGAREQTVIEIDRQTPEERRASLLMHREQAKISAAVSERLQARENQWRQIDGEIILARETLASAETALQSGRTPRPGERRGDVGGGSRLSESYFMRLRDLEKQVKQAKTRLDRAYAQRNALR